MKRTRLIKLTKAQHPYKDESVSRTNRFVRRPFTSTWFYTRVALNRWTPLRIPIRAVSLWGDALVGYESAEIGSMYFLGLYDFALTLFLLKHYHETGDILDVGANIGLHASLFSYLSQEFGQVYAFEPTPSTFSILQENVAGHANIKPFQLALSDTIGTKTFLDYGRRHGVFNSLQPQELSFLRDEGTTIKVNTDTFDNFCTTHEIKPSLIKLDTEGTEASILRQGIQTLEAHEPIILLEVGGGEAWAKNVRDCFDILDTCTYSFFELDNTGSLIPHTQQETYRYKNLVCIPESKLRHYVSNR